MAFSKRITGSESPTNMLVPTDDWGSQPLSERQQAALTLASILSDYVRDGGWRSEPQQRKAFYCWGALAGRTGDPRDDW